MSQNIENLAPKILNDEEKVKEILNIYDFEVLYDKIKSIEPKIDRRELYEVMENFSKNYMDQINEQDLEEISGGKKSRNHRVIAGLMSCLTGLSLGLGANVSATEISNGSKEQTISEKFKGGISNHKIELGAAGAGTIFLAALFFGSKYTRSKEYLLKSLPRLWEQFLKAVENAEGCTGLGGRRVSGLAGDAMQAAKYAAGIDVWIKIAGVPGDFHAAILGAWRDGGVAYDMVKNNDSEYFQKLTKTLQEQTRILKQAVLNQNKV